MAIYLNLLKKKLWNKLTRVEAIPAEDHVLALAHTESHIEKVRNTIYSDKTVKGEKVLIKPHENTHQFPSTYENKHTATAAYFAAGGTIEAVRAVCQKGGMGSVDSAFAIVRPPGHHAHCSAIAGFCFFNNVAVAARVA